MTRPALGRDHGDRASRENSRSAAPSRPTLGAIPEGGGTGTALAFAARGGLLILHRRVYPEGGASNK